MPGMTILTNRPGVRRAAVTASALAASLSAVLLAAVPSAQAEPPGPVPARAATAGPAATKAAQQAYYPNTDWIVCEVNKERANHGMTPLQISDPVSNTARAHARDMARTGKLSPVGSDGRDLRARLSDAKVFSSYIREYLFSGYTSDSYFADMATDPDTDFSKALMNQDVVAVGLGYDNRYWDVVLVGKHRKLVTRSPSCARP
ncbi:hypothetical protein CTZ27_11015 [Streptomyces griseocarneus]|nr:hypothetical protein CTZ27_11015 [Streptomyces griseocarneus]